MVSPERDARIEKLELNPETARSLTEHNVVRELDRAGHPHLLIKVPQLDQAVQADVGIEVGRGDDGAVTISVLLYDIPTEPVTYDLHFSPAQKEDLRYLKGFLDAAQFRLYPCARDSGQWFVGPCQTFKLPNDVLLRLRHYARDWPDWPTGSTQAEESDEDSQPSPAGINRSLDPRDTVIRKLKEQVQGLREQLQERDKRIIELEDELHEIRSRGRTYRLTGEKKAWWNPFS